MAPPCEHVALDNKNSAPVDTSVFPFVTPSLQTPSEGGRGRERGREGVEGEEDRLESGAAIHAHELYTRARTPPRAPTPAPCTTRLSVPPLMTYEVPNNSLNSLNTLLNLHAEIEGEGEGDVRCGDVGRDGEGGMRAFRVARPGRGLARWSSWLQSHSTCGRCAGLWLLSSLSSLTPPAVSPPRSSPPICLPTRFLCVGLWGGGVANASVKNRACKFDRLCGI